MRRYGWVLWTLGYGAGIAFLYLVIEDITPIDRNVFFELLKLVIPLFIIGVIGLIILLFALVLAVGGVIYVSKFAMGTRPQRRHRQSRIAFSPLGSARERITQHKVKRSSIDERITQLEKSKP